MKEQDDELIYIICPGPVRSMNDGQWHHIGASELAKLYGLSLGAPNVRVILDQGRSLMGSRRKENYRFLHPRQDGDYTLPV